MVINRCANEGNGVFPWPPEDLAQNVRLIEALMLARRELGVVEPREPLALRDFVDLLETHNADLHDFRSGVKFQAQMYVLDTSYYDSPNSKTPARAHQMAANGSHLDEIQQSYPHVTTRLITSEELLAKADELLSPSLAGLTGAKASGNAHAASARPTR